MDASTDNKESKMGNFTEIDEEFIEALKSGEYKEYIKDTLFFTFLTQSFPMELLKDELTSLVNNPGLVAEEHDNLIFKYTEKNSTYRFSSQIKVLQRMLGYTMIPRHVYNSDKALILYGVAGSGKTTIALHRIAYLIYNFQFLFFDFLLNIV